MLPRRDPGVTEQCGDSPQPLEDDIPIGTCGQPLKFRSGMGDGAVVIAVIFVWMMQMALHQIVSVITVRDRLMTASRAVTMLVVVGATGVGGRTDGTIRSNVGEHVLVDVTMPTVGAM